MTWTTRLRSDFGTLKAIRKGEGPLVLLLHGVGLRAEAWLPQIDALAKNYHVVAPDIPGHGESELTKEITTLSDYTDLIAMALDRSAIVAGHSMGAMIALDLAVRYPDRVSGVAALNAIFRRCSAAAAAVSARVAQLDGKTQPDPTATLQRWFGDVISAERHACQVWLSDVNPAGYRAAYTVFAEHDGPTDDALKSLGCPSLFMTGSDEPNSTPEMSWAMGKMVDEGTVSIIPDAAHMMPMTHAAQTITELQKFFRSVAHG